ncbi:MutS protein-like protein 5 [Colletotrichum orbiculare MAFF 240422]|uniref:DNA mismatch repair protein MSH5 n=1 Tax=Colletotrichum orbiculare (strain 104-T / ATCC 96160 / CBS 514.97 / LARS 414 / MAFF 240422) TaxID=1213857 RepID=A0A484FWS2_COLOR|nr:MutS protein-like protein 5 [Colletotrichum orbiculare MAFF 240422]
MAIDVHGKGSIGCAYFSPVDDCLFLLHDMPCHDMTQLVDMLIVHAAPTTVLLPLKIPEAALRMCEEYQKVSIEHRTTENRGFILRTLSSTDFGHAASLERLANLSLTDTEQAVVTSHGNVCDDTAGVRDENVNVRLMRLGSFIDLDCVLSIGCAGAVLGELMFVLSDFMAITQDTITSLQVFQSELHPNSLMSGQGSSDAGAKESLSLFGLFQPLVGTPQGRVKLRRMFVRPFVNIDKICERHRSISTLLRGDNAGALRDVSQLLRRITDVCRPLEQLQIGADAPTGGASVDRGVWWTLARFSLHFIKLRDAVLQLQHAQGLDFVQMIIRSVSVEEIKLVGEIIESVVDFEEAKASSRIAVKWNVNQELDDLKRLYHGLNSLLNEASISLSRDLPQWARQHVIGCVFWPQLGFFTSVTLLPNGRAAYEGQGLEDDAWERMFVADGRVFFKTRRMADLDAQLGDPYSGIVDMEVRILHELACRVVGHASTLRRAADACGELDCLVALANAAQKYGWAAPTMTLDNVISVQGGRHPLQELTVPSFVPNDCHLRGGSDILQGRHAGLPRRENSTAGDAETLIITGPNHSGKSVYAKQTALIVYLAHVGSYVPADCATIGITDQILARVSTKESVSRNESAFGIDLRQVAFSLRRATQRSLVVIDEFGKGTAAEDGAGLMAGLVDHFTALGRQIPKVVITTHYHEIFEGSFVQDRPGLSFAHMKVRLDGHAPQMEDQVLFLYELVPGRSTSSFGSTCAALNGFHDLNDEGIHGFVEEQAYRAGARNFVVELDLTEARVAFDLDSDDFGVLVGQAPPDGTVRWINIWSPGTQSSVIEGIGARYKFTPRLQALMTSLGHKPPRDTKPSQNLNLDDVELGYKPMETKTQVAAERRYEPRPQDSGDVEIYQLIKQTMNYTSIDRGDEFLCVGANWLHRRPKVDNIRQSPSLLPPKHWSWLTLCADSVVLSFHEEPPSEHPNDKVWVAEELRSMRSNFVDVLLQLSKKGIERYKRKAISLKSVRPPLPFTGSAKEAAHDISSNLFFYLFEDYSGAAPVVTASRAQIQTLSEQILTSTHRKSKLRTVDVIRPLHSLRRELRQLQHLFESYKSLIQRICRPRSVDAYRQGSLVVDESTANGTSRDVKLSRSARSRFESLQDRLQLLMLNTIQENLDELSALSDTYFNLTAQKDSQATARLSRSATVLAKLSVFFLPITFMTSYFSVEIPDLVEHYTPKTYWICFAIIAGLSFISLFFFSRMLEFLSDVLEGWADSVSRSCFGAREEIDEH